MMGEKVQIARQDTLLEVQTTGAQTQNTLDVVNGKIGNFGDTAEEGTLFGQMAGGSGVGSIKSIQVLIIKYDRTTEVDPLMFDGTYKDYTISPVNKDKTIVIITDNITLDSYNRKSSARLISNTTLRIYENADVSENGIYNCIAQVIEFN